MNLHNWAFCYYNHSKQKLKLLFHWWNWIDWFVFKHSFIFICQLVSSLRSSRTLNCSLTGGRPESDQNTRTRQERKENIHSADSLVTFILIIINPPADRNGKIKDGEHVGPLPLHVEVGDDGGSDGGVTGLADSDQTSSQQQDPEVLREHKHSREDLNASSSNFHTGR